MPGWGWALKLSFGGHIATAQSWSTGLWIQIAAPAGSLTQTQLDAANTTLNASVATWWTTAKASSNSDTTLDFQTLTYYTSGATHSTLISRITPTAVPGTGGVVSPAGQAIVASMRSATPGRSGRGRMYIPATGASLSGTNHQFPLSTCTNIANATSGLVTALNNADTSAAGITGKHCVINSVRNATSYNIARVVVDSLPDFQDRRQNKLAATALFSSTVA